MPGDSIVHALSMHCYTVLFIPKKMPGCYTVTRKVLPLAGGNREYTVIAHYNPKGFSCARGSPLTPAAHGSRLVEYR